MINVKIDIKQFSTESAGLEIEHIAQLIAQGYTSGMGWSLTGEKEKEPNIIQVEEEDEEEELSEVLN